MPETMSPSSSIHSQEKPWDLMVRLLNEGDVEALQQFVDLLPEGDLVFAVSHMDEEDQIRLLEALPPELAARILDEVPHIQAAEWLDDIDPTAAAAIIGELPSDEQADLIGDLEDEDAEAILDELSPAQAHSLRELARYEDDEAGGLMITEFLAYPAWYSTQDVVDDIRAGAESYARYPTQYLFVVDREQRLVGVLRLRDLLLSSRTARVDQIMIAEPLSIGHHAKMEDVDDFFERHGFLAVPVVDELGRLLGVVTRSDFQEAWSEQAEEDFLKSQGLMEEELRSMPLWRRAKGRLIWLGANVFLNAIAASVIAAHQDTLSAVIALAVFLPIVSDMSGNAGFQAAAVSMRELALVVVRPEEIWRVMGKEISVGLINGVVLGLLLGGLAWAWKGNAWLGLVAGGAMALNTVISVVIGGAMPLILKKFNRDPALAAGPILTTLTDMAGFFLVLSFAAACMERLV